MLEVRWNSLPFHWPCYAQVQRSGVIQAKRENNLRLYGSYRSLKCIIGVRVQPARRPCGNPWTEETYGEGISDGEFIQVKRECV
ncbi:hypothetical protein Taro_018367 [Colocasia esculenta]|uniref:Uncharacterized protein n=1 Tax=Colocasia esculenta TaxID=4460 RepID=A0A843UW11_COLES|nr:hypothetical protein [Colocasia esculenta]